jgi:5-methylcytosine-specific restriction enzyme A
MDLAAEAGVDVTDWADFAGGPERAATNPKYCYEWSFVQPAKVVVLNLWQRNMLTSGGKIIQEHNFLEGAGSARKSNWKTRNRKMSVAVATAWSDSLPVRVIICDGRMRDRNDPEARASEVTARELDVIPWAVTEYDPETGAVRITRGAKPASRSAGKSVRKREPIYPDELPSSNSYEEGARKRVIVNAYERDPRARRDCLRFFGYRCAACDLLFSERYGSLGTDFIHVHHVRPVSRPSKVHRVDPTCDLVPVCPNCHAMLHQKNPPMSIDRLRALLHSAARREAKASKS